MALQWRPELLNLILGSANPEVQHVFQRHADCGNVVLVLAHMWRPDVTLAELCTAQAQALRGTPCFAHAARSVGAWPAARARRESRGLWREQLGRPAGRRLSASCSQPASQPPAWVVAEPPSHPATHPAQPAIQPSSAIQPCTCIAAVTH